LTNPETYDKLSKSSGNGHKKNMGVFPSGQWGQTVNLLLFSFGGSNPPAPTKEKHLGTQVLGCFLFAVTHYETHFLTSKKQWWRNEIFKRKTPACRRYDLRNNEER
jgi:hypothetical protein